MNMMTGSTGIKQTSSTMALHKVNPMRGESEKDSHQRKSMVRQEKVYNIFARVPMISDLNAARSPNLRGRKYEDIRTFIL